MNFLFIPAESLASRLLWLGRKMPIVQSGTFKINFLHLNIERRLFWIDSVGTRIATSGMRKEFHKAVPAKLERTIWFSVSEKRRKAATAKEQQKTIYISGIFAWLPDDGVITRSHWLYIYLSELCPNEAKGFFAEPQRLKITSKVLWYRFCSLFLLCRQNKTDANMANASLHLFRNKCCRVFTLSYFCVLFAVSFIARSPFHHKRPREQLTVKEWSLS